MTVHEAKMEARGKAHADFRGQGLRGAESWQFFAFVFAATVTLLLAIIDEVPGVGLRLGLKVLAFFGVGYATLLNPRVRTSLVAVLDWFKGRG